MFKNLQNTLNKLEQPNEISVPIEPDVEGFFDKECPSENCRFLFKVRAEDWSEIVKDERVYCPSCGHTAPANSWFTSEQVEAAKEYALGTIINDVNRAMRADAVASKRKRDRNAFLSVTLDVRSDRDAVLVPVSAADPMRLKIACEFCDCRYSYIGAAYFCPSCGANSASQTFSQTLATIRIAAGLGEKLREMLSPDEAHVTIRTLLEKAMQDTVTSFQRLNEQLYETRTGMAARRNAFQNLDSGANLWMNEVGKTYADLIDKSKLDQLKVYFQQRHLLAHQQGIVDQEYINRSGDITYSVDQRLVIKQGAVREFADLVEELGEALIALAKV